MAAPVNTVAPAVTGTATIGNALSAGTGTWSNLPTSYVYAWLRGGAPIAGAAAASYTVSTDDIAATLRCRVTAANADGSASAESLSTTAVPGTLIVEDGTGFTNADSYSSLAAADSYHAKRGNATWATFTGGAKEAALRKATDYLDGFYGSRWLGNTFAQGQSLDWPRSGVPVPERTSGMWGAGVYFAATYLDPAPLPATLLRAAAELALKTATGTALSPDLGPAVKQETVGPITVIYQDRAVNVVSFSAVEEMLRRLLKNTAQVRVVRG